MHKNIRAAVIGRDRDKAISAIWVEEFDPPTWHAHLIRLQRTVSAPDPPRRRATATDRGLAHALRLFGTKRVMPKRVIPQKRLGRRSPNSLLRPHISGRSGWPCHGPAKGESNRRGGRCRGFMSTRRSAAAP